MGSLMQSLVCVCSNIRVPGFALCVCVWAERAREDSTNARRSEFLSGVQ